MKTLRKRRMNAVAWAVFALFVIYSVVILLPFVYGVITSLKTRYEYMEMPILSLFETPQWSNYVTAWTELATEGTGVPAMFLNSLWYAVGKTLFGLVFSSMAAYVVAKYSFPGRKIFYTFSIVIMMLPVMGAMASTLKVVQAIGAYNSPLFAVLEAEVLGATFIILYSTFKGVSWGYAEAAFMDGAGHLTVFVRVMLPQIISPLCALFLTNFITLWADGETPLIYFPDLPTLSTGLYLYQDVARKTLQYPVFFAGLLTCMVPTVALFAVFQKSLMDIQMGGGLKG